jgi:serralysin
MSHIPVGTVFKRFVGDTGGFGNDLIAGPNSSSVYRPLAWADYSIDGGGGDDELIGGHGDDEIFGGSGNDVISGGYGINDLLGEDGEDTLDYSDFGLNSSYEPATLGVYVDMINRFAESRVSQLDFDDEFLGFENVTGSYFNDQIYGDGQANDIKGLGGNDLLAGGSNDDFILGGLGADAIYGENDDDYLSGGRGNDLLNGGTGEDNLVGGRENDRLIGGTGADLMSGGSGEDTFVYKSVFDSDVFGEDFIIGFLPGLDTIDLRAIDADEFTAINERFTFIGRNAYSAFDSTGELRYSRVFNELGDDITVLEGDVDGDRVSDFSIALDGHLTLSARLGDILV